MKDFTVMCDIHTPPRLRFFLNLVSSSAIVLLTKIKKLQLVKIIDKNCIITLTPAFETLKEIDDYLVSEGCL